MERLGEVQNHLGLLDDNGLQEAYEEERSSIRKLFTADDLQATLGYQRLFL